MVEKEVRNNIINIYNKKEDKILVGSLIDNVNEFIIKNHLVHTKFLNVYEKNIAISVLNKLKVNYKCFDIIEDIERTVIFLIPDYIEEEKVYKDYIACLKIIPTVKNKLKHKDYMGAIYNLGLIENMIGDIFVIEDIGYIFIFKENLKFIEDNLSYVSNVKVETSTIDLNSEDINKIKINYKNVEIKVVSLRVDVVLAEVYNLSRNEIRRKIEDGDLIVNSNQMFYPAYEIKEKDIVSFKKCGKFKIGKMLGNTRSGKSNLEIKLYN